MEITKENYVSAAIQKLDLLISMTGYPMKYESMMPEERRIIEETQDLIAYLTKIDE